jgi:hypothetical protein
LGKQKEITMSHSASDDLVIELARAVVMQLAPEEAPWFAAASQAFVQDPKRLRGGHTPHDPMIGFGAGEAVTLLTPAALAMAGAAVQFVLSETTKATQAESTSAIQAAVRRIFKFLQPAPPKDKGQIPALTRAQLEQVRAVALQQARRMKLSDARAKTMADAIAGKLAVSLGAAP